RRAVVRARGVRLSSLAARLRLLVSSSAPNASLRRASRCGERLLLSSFRHRRLDRRCEPGLVRRRWPLAPGRRRDDSPLDVPLDFPARQPEDAALARLPRATPREPLSPSWSRPPPEQLRRPPADRPDLRHLRESRRLRARDGLLRRRFARAR